MPPVRAVFAVSALIVSSGSLGQDMMRHVDLASPEMTQAEVTRADVEILIQNGAPVDLSNRRLSGLDLSDLNLKAANLQASRRLCCARVLAALSNPTESAEAFGDILAAIGRGRREAVAKTR